MSKFIEVRLTRVHWQDVIDSLEAPDGLDMEVEECIKVARDIERQLDEHCASTAGRHVMIQPDDTLMIAWGEYGICTECFTVRKMPVGCVRVVSDA